MGGASCCRGYALRLSHRREIGESSPHPEHRSINDFLEIIARLQKQGKIRHVGLSEVKPHEIDQARKIIDIVSVQMQEIEDAAK